MQCGFGARIQSVALDKAAQAHAEFIAAILDAGRTDAYGHTTFFTIGRPFAGIICLILQLTLIGWIPATIWAVYSLSQYKTDQKIQKALGERRA